MAQIPLHKYVKREFPETPKSTIQYWATQAFYHGKGPFAHLGITRVGCRWYYRADDYDTGAVIGSVEIVDCVQHSTSEWFVGPYGFVLRNPELLKEPVPIRGQLGFFEVII